MSLFSADTVFLTLSAAGIFLVSWIGGNLFWSERTRFEKHLDMLGLVSQGVLVPTLSLIVAHQVLPLFLADYHQVIVTPGWVSFVIPFVIIDYLYYWNHRLLHTRGLWALHEVHHSARHFDLFISSRNHILTPLFLVYFWIYTGLFFLLSDKSYFMMSIALHSALDLWRHSQIPLPRSLSWLGGFIITSQDHQWHHSREKRDINFGANFNIWDRWHGTFYRSEDNSEVRPSRLGIERDNLSWKDVLLVPLPSFFWRWTDKELVK